jgi:hypothetical protein
MIRRREFIAVLGAAAHGKEPKRRTKMTCGVPVVSVLLVSF